MFLSLHIFAGSCPEITPGAAWGIIFLVFQKPSYIILLFRGNQGEIMPRLFLILFSSITLLLSTPVSAEVDQKAEVNRLYTEYKTQLRAKNIEEALKLAENMYALTPDAYGKKSKSHATAAFNLAQMYDLMKRSMVSSQYYQEHLDILDDLKVARDEKYLFKLGLLSDAYTNAGKYIEAVKPRRRALKIVRELKASDAVLAEFELAMGSAYYLSYGNFKKAIRHINKAADLFSKTLGEHHFKTGGAYFWQAKYYLGLRKHSKAAKKFETVLDIYLNELPAGDERILQTHAFLVNVYEKMGEKEKSNKHCIAVAVERPTDFDREIDPLYKVSPTYPRSALLSGKEGHIIAEFTVDELGQVKDIKTLEGKNVKAFEKNAHKALSQMRYAPSIKDGKRIKTEGVLHRVTFEMLK